ncbi:MAG: response regulator [Proteobacteria bacterium]|nr:response regulator [Pseudomonadota bacterium]
MFVGTNGFGHRKALIVLLVVALLAGLGVFLLFRSVTVHYIADIETQMRLRLSQSVSLAASTTVPIRDELRQGMISLPAAREQARQLVSRMVFEGSVGLDDVFMVDYSGHVLAHPLRIDLVGRNLWDHQDGKGLFVVRESVRLARERGGGFLSYLFRRTDGEPFEEKLSYIQDLPELECYLGIGLWVRDVRRTQERFMRLAGGLAILTLGFGLIPMVIGMRWTIQRQRRLTAEMSERALAQSLFRSSESRLRTVFEAADEVAFVLADRAGAMGRIVEFSPGAEKMFGYSRSEALGRDLSMLFDRTEARILAENMDGIRQGSGLSGRERLMVRRTGDSFTALCSVHPVSDGEGVVSGVLAACVDISARKHSEGITYLMYRIASLVGVTRDLGHLYQSLHEIIKDALGANNFFIGLLDEKQDRIVFPYYADEMSDRFFEIQGVSTAQHPSLAVHVLRTGKPLLITKDQKLKGLHGIKPRGAMSEIWLGVPLRIKGRVIGVMGIQDYHDPDAFSFDDVDLMLAISQQVAMAIERKTNEEALLEARLAAEMASQSKSEFLANMSHEIRTPLNGILGMAELTLVSELSDDQRENLKMLRDSGQALLRVLNDILDISKIEAGKLELMQEPFSLSALVASVEQIFSVQVRRKGITLEWFVDPGLPDQLVGDSGRLRQVLVNLVGNGVKFTDRGSVTVRVEQGDVVFGDGRMVPGAPMTCRFLVEDTGCGIPPDKLGKVFDSFTQVDGSMTRRYQGTGLGLAISRRLAGMMGGGITAGSVPGVGSRFEFTAVVYVGDGQNGQSIEASLLPLKPLRVLLAEDNKVNLLYAQRVLEGAGHVVQVAETGQKALDCLNGEVFDVVLMDIQMPDMDGMEATRRIRGGEAGEGNRDIPIVAMTAHAMKGDRERFLAVGMNDYISKPMESERINAVLCGLFHES